MTIIKGGGVGQNMTVDHNGGGGYKPLIFDDVIYGSPLSLILINNRLADH